MAILPFTYFTILEIISKRDTKIGKIAGRLNVAASHLTRYMQRLIDLDILKKGSLLQRKILKKAS